MSNATIKLQTVKLVSKILKSWVDEGIIGVLEEREIIANLRHLAERGEFQPVVIPKLIDQRGAAEMLGVSLSNFKKLESENAFNFKRKMVGSAVRYRNTDIIKYILSGD